jgi:hypothetical protein
MRTFAIFHGRVTATICLAFLTAGCDRLTSVATTTTPHDPARYTVVKDTLGRTVRLDKMTGEVTPVEKTKAPKSVQPTSSRAVAARSTPRVSRPRRPAPQLLASLPTIAPARVVTSQPVILARPEPARIASDEMCAEHDDIFAVTLVDAAVFASPSIGTPLVTRVIGGTLVTMTGDSGEWLYVTFEGRRGPLSGFVHCSTLRSLASAGVVPTDDPGSTEDF